MKTSVNESKFFLILMEASQYECSLICVDLSLKSMDEWRNLFYIVYNRCNAVTRFLNLFFSVYKKKVALKRGCERIFFLSEQANFSVSDRLGRNFPTVQNGLEKRKNLYLIKLVSKQKRKVIGFCFFIFVIWSFWFFIFVIWNWCQANQHEILRQVI